MKNNHTALLRCGTIGRGGDEKLLAAAKHNLREIPAASADPERSGRNEVLRGPSQATAVLDLAIRMREAVGYVRRRHDDTIAAEIIFSLPTRCAIVPRGYMLECLEWIEQTFGADAVFSAVMHLDEAAPHLHILLLPVRQGVWVKSKVFGDRKGLKELQDDFHARVASRFGLARAPEKLCAKDRSALSSHVVEHLKRTGDPCVKSAIWLLVRDGIEADPEPFAETLGLKIRRTMRTSTQIFTSTGKGARLRDEGNAIAVSGKNARRLSCVAVRQTDRPIVSGTGVHAGADIARANSNGDGSAVGPNRAGDQQVSDLVSADRPLPQAVRPDETHMARPASGEAAAPRQQVRSGGTQQKPGRAETACVPSALNDLAAGLNAPLNAKRGPAVVSVLAPTSPELGRFRGTLHLTTLRDQRAALLAA